MREGASWARYKASYPDKKRAGTRFYIHARNIAAAVQFLLKNGSVGEKYNITGEKEVDNLELAQFIADVCEKPLDYEMVNFHASRPGHDLRYGLSGKKMEAMGWELPLGFEDSLRKTIQWTIENQRWLNAETWDGETVNVDSESDLWDALFYKFTCNDTQNYLYSMRRLFLENETREHARITVHCSYTIALLWQKNYPGWYIK